jgi:DNA modification methylase
MTQPYSLHTGDCLEVLKSLDAESIDAIVTDPPYGLAFMGKKWDYDVPSTDIWQECLRVLKPGGHLLAFAGTRTQHRMACRIEDAGFEIRDMIAWVYGSGFPKSLDVSKAIDKAAGAEREKIRVKPPRNQWYDVRKSGHKAMD